MRKRQRPDIRLLDHQPSPPTDLAPRPSEHQVAGLSLLKAASEGAIDIARALLDEGADVDVVGSDGRTPLMVAASCHQAAMVEWLLLNGASLDRRDAFGLSPLEIARAAGADEIVTILQRHRPWV